VADCVLRWCLESQEQGQLPSSLRLQPRQVTVRRDQLAPEFVALVSARLAGRHLEAALTDLDARLRLGAEVEIPGWLMPCAVVGRNHHEVLVVGGVLNGRLVLRPEWRPIVSSSSTG
jgi:hypothetical protein